MNFAAPADVVRAIDLDALLAQCARPAQRLAGAPLHRRLCRAGLAKTLRETA